MAQQKEEWLQTIATKAEVAVSAVEKLLAIHRIQASPVLAEPRRLILNELEFSGAKEGIDGAGPFTFHWRDLTHGLWAMLSQKNLRGKSTIIEIVRWVLRGRPSDNLQEDVRRWVHAVRLTFLLDDDQYEVAIRTQGRLEGELWRVRADSSGSEPCKTALAEFSTDGEFEAVMADFFMRAFAMEPISTWRKAEDDGGQAVTHSWVAFSGAMFIGTSYEVLLGDMPVTGGMTSRLMQMYLGVPWVSTLAAGKAALQAVEQSVQVSDRRSAAIQAAAAARVENIRSQLEGKRAALAEIPSDQAVRDAIHAATVELSKVRWDEQAAMVRAADARAALRDFLSANQEDRSDLQTHLDATSAVAVFRRLEPKCCPRCDHEISKAKKALEQSTRACSVCGESVESSEDGEAIKAELQQRVAAAAAAVKSARDALREEEDELRTLGAKAEDLHAQVATHTQALSSAVQRQDAAMAVAVLEGRLEEALSLPETESQDRGTDLKVLSTLVSETEMRVKSLRDGLLEDVSKRLIEYAKDFGLQNLSAATLKGNASLSLIKGGTPTSYSKVTDGEKLRLKVATVLAMIEVAETRGVGRHPGLLMIDSPGAQEVAPEDVDHLVSGLQSIASKLPYLQVFVAGISSPAITSHVPKDRRKEAFGEQFLW